MAGIFQEIWPEQKFKFFWSYKNRRKKIVKILKLLGATTMLYGGQKQKEKTFEYWSH